MRPNKEKLVAVREYLLDGDGHITVRSPFNDSGTLKTVYAGDVTITSAEQGHGTINIGDEPLEIIALILYKYCLDESMEAYLT